MNQALQIALVSGPAYDRLYRTIPEFTALTGIEVNIAYRGDHPALNQHLENLSEVPYDLISTHTKYAPSQTDFLAPLDGLITADVLNEFVPQVLNLAKIGDALYGLPRNIDVRLLHYRTDIFPSPPKNWDDLYESALDANAPPEMFGFVFPGKESGLFGTFYELAEMGGAKLFPESLIPDIENEGGRWALELLGKFYQNQHLPDSFKNWHFEEVHELFRLGRAAMVGDFPGYYKYYQDAEISKITNRFAICPYPVGPSGESLAYGGSHTFALTKKGAENLQALALMLFLTDYEQQLFEAQNGCMPVRRSVLRRMKNDAGKQDADRLEMLEQVISNHILIPPKLAIFPEIENILWTTVQQSILGLIPVAKALEQMTGQIERLMNEASSSPNGGKAKKNFAL